MAAPEFLNIARDMAFAQVVNTTKGDALLIGGTVYYVEGPTGNAALAFARGMRSGKTDTNITGDRYKDAIRPVHLGGWDLAVPLTRFENASLEDARVAQEAEQALHNYATGAFAAPTPEPTADEDDGALFDITVYFKGGAEKTFLQVLGYEVANNGALSIIDEDGAVYFMTRVWETVDSVRSGAKGST